MEGKCGNKVWQYAYWILITKFVLPLKHPSSTFSHFLCTPLWTLNPPTDPLHWFCYFAPQGFMNGKCSWIVSKCQIWKTSLSFLVNFFGSTLISTSILLSDASVQPWFFGTFTKPTISCCFCHSFFFQFFWNCNSIYHKVVLFFSKLEEMIVFYRGYFVSFYLFFSWSGGGFSF